MAISLASLKKSAPPINPIAVLYGVAGVGKDTLASEFPNPVLICTPGENPPAGVVVDTWHLENLADVMSAIVALFTEDHTYGTLIISALAGIERMVWAETCSRNKWKSIEEPGYGRGYAEADSVWTELLDGLRALRRDKQLNIVLIGHTEIKSFDDPASTSYSRYQPNLHKRAAEQVLAAADIVGFVNFRSSIRTEKGAFGAEKKEVNGAGVRTIYLEERPGFLAKNRYGMTDSVPFVRGKGFEAIAKYLPKQEVA